MVNDKDIRGVLRALPKYATYYFTKASVKRALPENELLALAEEAGLKGYKVGGAQVSPKHAGFVVNCGNATAADVLQLIADVRRVIMEKAGVELHPEVLVIGEE